MTSFELKAVCLRTMCSKLMPGINKVGYKKGWNFNTFNIVLNTGSTKLFWDFSISQSCQKVENLIRRPIKIHLFVDST